jgi:hypothetical protein
MQLICICCMFRLLLKASHALVSAAGTATTPKILVSCPRPQGALLLLLLLLLLPGAAAAGGAAAAAVLYADWLIFHERT